MYRDISKPVEKRFSNAMSTYELEFLLQRFPVDDRFALAIKNISQERFIRLLEVDTSKNEIKINVVLIGN